MLEKIKEFVFILFNEDKMDEVSKPEVQPQPQSVSYKHQYKDDDEDIMLFVRLVNASNKSN